MNLICTTNTRVILRVNLHKDYLIQLTSENFVNNVAKYRLGTNMEEIAEEALNESNNAIFFYKSLSFGRNSECKVIWTRRGGK